MTAMEELCERTLRLLPSPRRRRRERDPLMKQRTSRDAKLVHGRTAFHSRRDVWKLLACG